MTKDERNEADGCFSTAESGTSGVTYCCILKTGI